MSQRANLIKNRGLITSGSELSLPEGSLRQATNINIDENGVATPRRGFNDYGDATDPVATKRIKQLIDYKNRLFRHFEDQIQFEDENGLFQDIAGSYTEVRSGYRTKHQETKGNLYFTTEEGIKRISVKNENGLSSTSTVIIDQAGVPKAAYMEGTAVNTVGGFLPAQSKVAYRFLFGRKDNNNNLLLGSPSAREVISNVNDKEVTSETIEITINQNHPTNQIENQDYIVINSLGSRYTFYFKIDTSDVEPPYNNNTFGTNFTRVDISNFHDQDSNVAATLANEMSNVMQEYSVSLSGNIITLTSNEEGNIDDPTYFFDKTIDNTPNYDGTVSYSIGQSVSFNNLEYTCLVATTGLNDGSEDPSGTDSDNVYWQYSATHIIDDGVDVFVSVQGNLVEGSSTNTELTLILPSDIDDNYFVQVYRTAIISAVEGLDLDDIDPGDESSIVYEASITSTEITAGELVFTDSTPESFRASGAPLYTNEITGEGILQSNDPPPIALDIDLFRNSVFYANTKSAHRVEFDMLSVDNFVSDSTRFVIGNSTVTRYYTAVFDTDKDTSETPDTPEGGDFYLSPSVSVGQAIDQTARSLVKIINQDSLSPVNAFYLTGADDLPGQLLLEARDLSDDTLYVGIDSGYDKHINGTVYANGAFVNFNSLDYIHSNIDTFLNTPWDSGVTYQTGDVVSNSGQLWIAIDNEDPNLNKDPSSEVEFWQNYSAILFQYSDQSLVRFEGSIYLANASNSDTDPSTSVNWDEFNEDPTGTKTNNTLWSYVDIAAEFTPELGLSRPMIRLAGNTNTTKIKLQGTGLGITDGDSKFISFLNQSSIYTDVSTYFAGDIVSYNDEYHECIDDNAGSGITGIDPTNLVNWQVITYLPDSFSGVFTVSNVVETTDTEFEIEYTLSTSFVSDGANPFLVDNSAVFDTTLESDNLEIPNRLYYSKVNEPEAVPIANFIDVGAKDEEIKRILALRDNLFVLKDDGIFIVSGTSAPNFSVRLLDNTRIIAPDSATVLNNQIYCLTEQGITVVTDSGAGVISRGIENLVDDVANAKFDFVPNTFGIPYENDRAYILFMPSDDDDTSATQAYRYNIFERTWTKWEYQATCGLVMERDAKLYLGDGDRNFVAQERKNFDRTDHSDRDFTIQIAADGVDGTEIKVSNSDNIEVADVITQTQEVTINYFNNRLLRRMDTFDTGLGLGNEGGIVSTTNPVQLATPYPHNVENGSSWEVRITYEEGGSPVTETNIYTVTKVSDSVISIDFDNSSGILQSAKFIDYYQRTFGAVAGDDMSDITQALNDYLVTIDPWDGSSGFTVKVINNANLVDSIGTLVDELNLTDTITTLKDYTKPESVTYEAYITSIDAPNNLVYVHQARPFVQDDIEIYKHIKKTIEWNPQHFGDPSAIKQIREVTILFDQNNFYDAIAKFGSDVDQALTEVPFQGKGIGYWGDKVFDDPNAYWGGEGNDIPFRTMVPRGKQKCRYLTLVFEHSNAREEFRVLGVTGVIRPISSRGYR